MNQIRVCVFGHSGSGKSMAARYLLQRFQEHGYTTDWIKLAEPLYRLQGQIYATAGRPIERYAQDQHMLEWLARECRRINPHALVEDFDRRLRASTAQVVMCDDLRDGKVDYPYLKENGFTFVHIRVGAEMARQRLQQRQDLSTVFASPASQDVDTMPYDVVVDNDKNDPDHLHRQLEEVVVRLIRASGVGGRGPAQR